MISKLCVTCSQKPVVGLATSSTGGAISYFDLLTSMSMNEFMKSTAPYIEYIILIMSLAIALLTVWGLVKKHVLNRKEIQHIKEVE